MQGNKLIPLSNVSEEIISPSRKAELCNHMKDLIEALFLGAGSQRKDLKQEPLYNPTQNIVIYPTPVYIGHGNWRYVLFTEEKATQLLSKLNSLGQEDRRDLKHQIIQEIPSSERITYDAYVKNNSHKGMGY